MHRAGDRLNSATLAKNFADDPPALGDRDAVIEAARCVFCYDAPCTRACPTDIDVPKFIRQILHDDALGAARTILDENVFGGSCARACPTEVLCEGVCVDRARGKAPVEIGRLQRYACDVADAAGVAFHEAGADTGRRVAIVGAGPAGLTCAYECRKRGHAATVFDASDVAGGLNTVGIAAYKISTAFALTEVARVERLGVDVRLGHAIDTDGLRDLLHDFDAVFVGVGLGRTRDLDIDGESLPGVVEALDFVRQTHTGPLADCTVGRRVVVIGGGNTAVDVATAAARLGAEEVTIAYRRGEAAMPAFRHEYERTQKDGIRWQWFARPTAIVERDGRAAGVAFVRTTPAEPGSRGGALADVPDSAFTLDADLVVKALGQAPHADWLTAIDGVAVDRGRVVVDPATGRTGAKKLWAGGDCITRGAEVVDAVQQGKIAARDIDRVLREEATR